MKNIFTLFIYILVVAFNFYGCSKSNTPQQIITDEAGLFDKHKELLAKYSDFNKHMLMDFDIDFRVLTSYSQEEVDLYTNKKFNELDSRSKSGKTILLVVNIGQNMTRVEVSMALEHIYTDAFISYVERKGMVPYFMDSKIVDGIYMMSELVRDRATEARNGAEFVAPMSSKSIGGGAKTKAKLGQTDVDAKKGKNIASNTNDTPQDVLNKYFQSLKEHNKNPYLDIFTSDTKKFFSSWTVTDINQNNELRFTSKCKDGKFYTSYDKFAVLSQPLEPRTCAPYLFKKENGVWKIDIYTMAKTILFNKNMLWHFNMKEKPKYLTDYEFAFKNYSYDENGFPYYKRKKTKLRWGYQCGPWYTPDEKEKEKCYISWLDQNARAKNELGLVKNDAIMGIGNGNSRVQRPTKKEFMDYLKYAPTSKKVYVRVYRKRKIVELEAIAP